MVGFVFALLFAVHVVSGERNLHSFSALDIDGNKVELSRYRGKVVLVVNVASDCGYTDDNYRWLNDVQDAIGKQKLAILAFPCNQFGRQEPGTSEQIKEFAASRKATFDLFSKVRVTGSNAHSIFKYLAHKSNDHPPTWNFAKYLVSGVGDVVSFFDTQVALGDVMKAIENEVNALHLREDL